MPATGGEDQPAATFGALARLMYEADTLDDVYGTLCRMAPGVVTGCDHASVLLAPARPAHHGGGQRRHRHRDRPGRAASRGRPVRGRDRGGDGADRPGSDRHPGVAAAVGLGGCAHTGAGAMAFRLTVDGEKSGALDLFADRPAVLTAQAANEGAVLASGRRRAADPTLRGFHEEGGIKWADMKIAAGVTL